MEGRIGRYRIQGELGRGAMGVVYLAIDPAIGRRVAIKTIRIRDHNSQAEQDKLRERLFREARSAGVLSHPNIVTIYDVDEDEGVAWVAMEFVNGPSLDKVITTPRAIAGAQMLQVLRQSASALDYAHSRGVVHRDVKPGNIMIDEAGSVKITDFGIAKITSPASDTDTNSVTGTPGYMSPEQVQGHVVDSRSDQFSLAVIAWEILTGERPFQGEQLSTVVYRIVAEQPVEAQRINPTLTPAINVVLQRALAKNPAARFPSCAAFVGSLEIACAESRGWRPLAAGAAQSMPTTALAPTRPMSNVEAPQFATGATTGTRHSRVAAVLAGLVVAAGLSAVFAWEAGVLPGFNSSASEPVAAAPEPIPETVPPVTPQVAPEVTPEPAPAPVEQAKPSPLPLPDADAAPEPPAAAPAAPISAPVRSIPRAQDVWVTTNPPGAKVVFDGDVSAACLAPCMLHGPAGVHHLKYSLTGYQNEYREIHVGGTALDAPLVTMRQPGGTLMVTTRPPGANVSVDGTQFAGVTPAQIPLTPGSHSVTVELGGKTQTQSVEIRESPVYLRFTLPD